MGKKCTSPIDCLSNTCTAGLCEPPLCADDQIDGEETDSDCGGPTCPKCDRGKACRLPRDCKNAQCTDGKCVSSCPPGSEDCDGNAMNGCESRVDFDRQNCGGCFVVCEKTNPFCVGGSCSYHMQALAGSFHVGDGPPAASNPTPQSCIETCARIFGSVPSDYSCSTTNEGIDKRAFADGPADPSHCTTDPVSDTFKLGTTYACSTKGCACSTYVADHAECAQATNWCFR